MIYWPGVCCTLFSDSLTLCWTHCCVKRPNQSRACLLVSTRSFNGKMSQMFHQQHHKWRTAVYRVCTHGVFFQACMCSQFVWLLLWRQLGKHPHILHLLHLLLLCAGLLTFTVLPSLLKLQKHSSLRASGSSIDTFMVHHEISRWSQLSLWTSVVQPPGTDQ